MRLILVAAVAMAAIPAASAQYIKLNDIDGETKKARCASQVDAQTGEGINGGLNRDIIRRTPRPPREPEPKPQESAGKAPELNAPAAPARTARTARAAKRGEITLKRGGC